MSAWAPELVLVAAVAGVGVLHTAVPDHWVPITLIARQRGWSRSQTARAALIAGVGHVTSTLALATLVWIAGVIVARRYGHLVDTLASLALVAFGAWIAVAAMLELRRADGHGGGHPHGHGRGHTHDRADRHVHDDRPRAGGSRMALLLILGSSPMVEGIPAFFAAARYGPGLIALMAAVFAASTMATYLVLSVASQAGLERLRLGRIERYGEVLSGVLIAVVGFVFWRLSPV